MQGSFSIRNKNNMRLREEPYDHFNTCKKNMR